MAFLAFNNIKLNRLAVANATNHLRGVIFDYGRLVNKNILVFFVVTAYKAIAVLNIEPLDGSEYIRCDNFLRGLLGGRLLYSIGAVGMII